MGQAERGWYVSQHAMWRGWGGGMFGVYPSMPLGRQRETAGHMHPRVIEVLTRSHLNCSLIYSFLHFRIVTGTQG